MKEPWGNKVWPTKAKFMSWLRGGIRKSLWNRSPIKIEFINKHRKRIPNPNPKGKVATVWGGECGICKNDFVIADLQVDHIKGGHSLRELSDIQSFIEGIVLVSEDDLMLVCKQCHSAKTLSEKKGISQADAVIEKEVIAFSKLSAETQKKLLTAYGYESNMTTSATKRKECYREYLINKEKCDE